MHIDIGSGAKIEATRGEGGNQVMVEFHSTKRVTSSVRGDLSVYLHFEDEKDAEKMAFDILHRLGHRFHDGKHTLAPITPEPPYKIWTDPEKPESAVLIVGSHWFHGDEARDMAFLMNKAHDERLANKG